MITDAQRDLLIRIGFVPNALRNDDEVRPKWWIEGKSGGVKANVAASLVKRGLVRISGHWGGWPGIDGFTVTPAGRRALSVQPKGEGGGDG